MDCPIHLGEIALDTEKAAALPCGHVFCLSCITTCFDVKRAKSGPCPICKKETKKAQIIPLFLGLRSTSSSPTKSQDAGNISAAGKTHVKALLQHFQALHTSRSVDSNDDTIGCSEVDIDHSAVSVTGTPDMESKCLAEEIKAAALHFQRLILPELKDLRTVRAEAKRLGEENALLKSTLHLKDKEIENHDRCRISVELELANLQMAKRLSDDKASSLREALSVKSGRLIDAENTICDKVEEILQKDADIKQYRRWASDSKIKTERYKARIRKLEADLIELKQSAHSVFQGEHSSQGSIADSRPLPLKMRDDEDEDYTDIQRPPKRPRTEKLTLTDVKLDRSCFVTKPPPSFVIPVKKRPEKHAASFSGLNITNDGHVKGPVMLGSKQRMGKWA